MFLVSIPDGDVWFFKSVLMWFSPAYPRGFNPRWGCMVFQIHCERYGPLPSSWFQSPMGMYGFSNLLSDKPDNE